MTSLPSQARAFETSRTLPVEHCEPWQIVTVFPQ